MDTPAWRATSTMVGLLLRGAHVNAFLTGRNGGAAQAVTTRDPDYFCPWPWQPVWQPWRQAWQRPLRAAALGVHGGLEASAGAELGQLGGGDLDLVAGGGLTPVRAARACCLKLPKPGMDTVPPFLTVVTMASSRVSTMRPASALLTSCLVARWLIRSVLFMLPVDREARTTRGRRRLWPMRAIALPGEITAGRDGPDCSSAHAGQSARARRFHCG